MKLVRNKTTGRIHDVPDNHWSLDPGQWPRGRKPTNRGVVAEGFAEEYEELEVENYEWDGAKGWVEKTPSRSRSTRTRAEPDES